MKTVLTMCLLGVLLLAGGCGNERSEKKIDGFLTAMVAARNQRVNLISLDENELKFAREELASMMPQQKSQAQKDLENALKSRGEKVEEAVVDEKKIEQKRAEIAAMEERIALKKQAVGEHPNDAKKAVFIEMAAFYHALPPDAQSEFLRMIEDDELWINGIRSRMNQYQLVLYYEKSDEIKQKIAEFIEKLGCRVVDGHLYYDSLDALNRAYETAKNSFKK